MLNLLLGLGGLGLLGTGLGRALGGSGINWRTLTKGYQVPPAPSYEVPEFQTDINKALYEALIPRLQGEGVELPVEDIMKAATQEAESFTQKKWQQMAPKFAYGRMLQSGQARQAYQDLLKDVSTSLANLKASLLKESAQAKQSAIENALRTALSYGQYLGSEARAYQEPTMAEWQAKLQKARDVYSALVNAILKRADLSEREKEGWIDFLGSVLVKGIPYFL